MSAHEQRSILARVQRGELAVADAIALLGGSSSPTPATTGETLVAFEPGWERADATVGSAADTSPIVVIDDGAGLDPATLPAGALLVRARAGDELREPAGGVWELDPLGSGWPALIAAVADRDATARLVVVGAGVERPPWHSLDTAFPLLRALIAERRLKSAALAFVVPGLGSAQAVDALGALCQIAAHEDRRIRALAIGAEQLPAGTADGVALGLGELAGTTPGGATVRHDIAGRWRRTIRPAPAASRGSARFRQGGTYLVTGGAGGVGLALSELLAEHHAARLVLMGRSDLNAEQFARLERIERAGGRALYVSGDVTRPDDVANAVQQARSAFGRIDGVLHAAGVNQDAYIVNREPAAVRQVLATKLAGAALLDAVTADDPLDLFVVFSSTAAFLRMPGQADYAAANRALGTFAAERGTAVADGDRSGRTVCVAWPLWLGGGMDVDEQGRRVLEDIQGMRPMPAGEGLRALEDALAGSAPERLVVWGDPGRARAHVDACMADLEPATAQPAPAGGFAADGEELQRRLVELICATIKLPPGQLGIDQELATVGVDSILIKRLTATLEDRLGPLPVTLLFEHRTVRELAAHLLEHHSGAVASLLRPGDTASEPPASPPAARPAPAARCVSRRDAIAIVGMAGRYPGSEDLEGFWEDLVAGRDRIGDIPIDRWDHNRYFDPERRPGMSYGRWGGFLDDVARFDDRFFGIPPREAERIDPKERLFIEVAWAALEHAGYSRALLHRRTLRGDRHAGGVFVGVTGSSYGILGAEQWGRGKRVISYTMDFSTANRLSYLLDLHGPSLVVDTACSASLTALHLACESLRSGECAMAISGGVYVTVHPSRYTTLSDLRMLASDGRCRSFGAGGDGFVPGEGVGALILKPLAAAEADGDHVHAVIRATAINHGGRTNGYTVPAPRAQGAVVAQALERAAIDAGSIGYVEAHGTGTALGDPIEIEGLARAFAEHTSDASGTCAIGSVKSNIGHLESAAGVAGVTKAVLQLERRTLVPTLHCDPPNPQIDFDATPFVPQRELAPWPSPADSAPRRAAVSSFGAGGANGHVILEEYVDQRAAAAGGDGARLIVLSALTDERLRVVVERLYAHLQDVDGLALVDVAATLALGRDPLEHRLAVVVSSFAELREALRAFLDGRVAQADLHVGRADRAARPAGEGELAELAARWVTGSDLRWERLLPSSHRHVPLPSYPFAGRRHWIDVDDDTPSGRDGRLLCCVPSVDGARFEAVLGADAPPIGDHVVGGRTILAGVAQLELARAAAAMLGEGEIVALADVRWRAPLPVANATTVDVTLRRGDGGLRFEIATEDSVRTVHADGLVSTGARSELERVNADGVRERCRERIDGAEMYASAARAGLAYGPTYRGVAALWRGDGEALAELTSPADPGDEAWWIAPGATDAALHAVQGLVPAGPTGRAMLPASLREVRIAGDPRLARLAHARLLDLDAAGGSARCDVVVCDDEGTALLAFRDLRMLRPAEPATRPLAAVASPPATPHADRPAASAPPCFRPRWRLEPLGDRPAPAVTGEPALIVSSDADFGLGEQLARRHGTASVVVDAATLDSPQRCAEALAAAGDPRTIHVLGAIDDRRASANDLDHLARAHARGAGPLFELARLLATTRPVGMRVRVATADVHQTDDAIAARNPFAATTAGLARAIANELAAVDLSCVDLACDDLERCRRRGAWDDLIDAVLTEPAARPAREVALRQASRLVRGLQRVELADPGPAALPLRHGGRYLVLGGAGGLGLAVSRSLARSHAARLALVGRRPAEQLDPTMLASLDGCGGEATYRQADVADLAAMQRVVADLRERWGGIDGVIHSAFVLADRTLARMDDETFEAALTAKVRGTMVLQRVLEHEPLDFLALFSSGISFAANPGQANYTAASAFQDAYGRFLATRLQRPAIVFNWGFWGESGSVATPEHRDRLARWGAEPLTDAEGVAAFHQALASGAPQLAPVKATAALMNAHGADATTSAEPVASSACPLLVAGVRATTAALREAPSVPGAEHLEQMQAHARSLVVAAIRREGALQRGGEVHELDALASRLGVAGDQRRLLDALLAGLVAARFLEREGDCLRTLPAVEQAGEPEAEAAAIAERWPHARAALALMSDCAAALPAVLRGQRRGIEVLFPGGSDERLAPLYRDDPRAVHFNALCAGAVAGCAQARLADGGELSLLEIGAGTGGSTGPVLERLERTDLDLTHIRYLFTDVATGLVRNARERFSRDAPRLEFAVLDIAADPAEQGITGHYDVILASNVLHATPDVRATLANVKALLAPGGVLVLNEATSVLDSVSLVFGLTDGWWLAEDRERRLPHSPLLSVGQWHAALVDAGLRGVRSFGIADHDDEGAGQHVFVAEHDGWRTVQAAPVDAPARGAPEHDDAAESHPAAGAEDRPTERPPAGVRRASPARHPAVIAYAAGHVAAVLKLPADELDPGAPLEIYGADSLVAMEVVERLEQDLGPLPADLTPQGGSVEDLAAALTEHAGSRLAGQLGVDIAAPIASKEYLPDATASVAPDVPAIGASDDDSAPVAQSASAARGDTVPAPIAIVGLAGRYPGAADPDELWECVRDGRRSITEVPRERWPVDAGGHGPHRWGGFLDDIDRFDPLLFRISPRDAERIDPQERLFLESVWTVLEDAAYSRGRLDALARRSGGAGVGVFAGVMHAPYQLCAVREGVRTPVSSAPWAVANRASHAFGLDGPSLAVDTACSSSLTALHLACESLRRDECELAIAGGANLILHPAHHVGLDAAGMLSSDGRSRAFAAGGDGCVTGEGVGTVVLKSLADAERDGDRIHGVLIGSAINSNGPTPTMVEPSPEAQAELIAGALRRSRIDPATIGYVEAQAMGSPIGDPVEVASLARVLRPAGGGEQCGIGSLKPNIGHLEAASGIAQLTKVLLALRHRELAPTIDAEPVLDTLADAPFRLVQAPEPWPAPVCGIRRRAAINSFGAGGANAHVVVEEAPQPRPRDDSGPPRPQLVVLSARRPERLRSHAERLARFLRGPGQRLALSDIAYTLQIGRTALAARLALVAESTTQLAAALDAFAAGDERGVCTGTVGAARRHGARAVAAADPDPSPERLSELARAWADGTTIAWTHLHRPRPRVVSLPGYPFARERYWLTDPPPNGSGGASSMTIADHAGNDTHQAARAGLVRAISEVLDIPAAEVAMEDHLSDLGLDSVTLVELADRLGESLSLEVSPTALFAHPDLAGVVGELAGRLDGDVGSPAEDAPTTAATVEQPPPSPAAAPRPEPSQPQRASARREPVAVVGMAGAFPGSSDLDAFWANLLAGRDLVTDIPGERFDWREIYGDPSVDPDKVACRWGGFLDDVACFDAEFFSISPREARCMDPQHRLFLETAWAAIEDAGHHPGSLAGSRTGVFVGVASSEYSQLLLASGADLDGQLATGNDHSVLANRVSFLLDLHGPSEPIDTACSSSLTAVHRAVQAIEQGDCEQALVGGVNVILSPNGFVAFGRSGMLAGDGRCKSFDHRADGYVRGEGVGALLVKPLSRAREDGDRVRALIVGSATNHGGRATSLTAPNPTAQADVIVRAHRRAGATPGSIGYIEAHGTGTALGDPVEVEGLVQAFAALGGNGQRQYCALGSVKTNVGHLETAAGVAGLIKAILALEHGVLPPTLHLERPNPLLELAKTPFFLLDEARPWKTPNGGGPRRCGVSSFGFGGANAHVVLQEADESGGARNEEVAPGGPHAFVLSARDGERLRCSAQRLLARLEHLATTGRLHTLSAIDVAYTLQVGRPALETRLAIVCDTLDALCDALRDHVAGSEHADVFTSSCGDAAGDPAIRALADERHLAALAREGDARRLAPIWTSGVDLDWASVHEGASRRRVPLPTYPFARERHWFQSSPGRTDSAAVAASDESRAPAVAAATSVDPATAPAATAPDADDAPPASAEDAPLARLHAQIRAYVAQGIGLEPADIDPARDFSAYGIDSIAALRIMQRIQATFGDDIAMAAIFEHATLDRFVDHLASAHPRTLGAGNAPASDDAAQGTPPAVAPTAESTPPAPTPTPTPTATAAASRIMPLVARDSGVPLFCLAGDTGELSWALPLLDALAAAGPVLGIEAPGFPEAPPLNDLGSLAEHCAGAIAASDDASSGCRIAGHGLAGTLAVEVARALLDRGHEVSELLLVDVPEPGADGEPAPDHLVAVTGLLAGGWGGGRLDPHDLPAGDDEARLARAVELLAPAAPMPAQRLRGWLRAALAWRATIAAGVRHHAARPLAGLPAATVVRAGATGGDWSRWLAPPPRVVDVCGTSVDAVALAAALAPDATTSSQPPTTSSVGVNGATAPADTELSSLVPINRGGTRTPSIWAHHLFGDVSYCMYLSRHLGLDYPLFAVQQIDMESRFRHFEDLRAMCAHYVDALRETFPQGPYTLGGASLGGVVAYEMAGQLLSAGEHVAHLCLIDPLMPGTGAWDGVDTTDIGERHQDALTMMLIGNSFCQLWGVPDLIDVETLIGCDEQQRLDKIAAHVAAGSEAAPAAKTVRLLAERKWEVLQLNNELLAEYEPAPLPAPVDTLVFHATLGFSARENPYGMPEIRRLDGDRTNGLSGLAGERLTVHDIEADHFTIVHDDNLRRIAELIRPVLNPGGAAEPTTTGEPR